MRIAPTQAPAPLAAPLALLSPLVPSLPRPSSAMLSPTSSSSSAVDDGPPCLFDANPLRYMIQCNRHGGQQQQQAAAAAAGASGAQSATAVAASPAGSSSAPAPAAAASASSWSLRLRIPSTETRVEPDSKKPYTVFLIQIIACCSSFSQDTTRTHEENDAQTSRRAEDAVHASHRCAPALFAAALYQASFVATAISSICTAICARSSASPPAPPALRCRSSRRCCPPSASSGPASRRISWPRDEPHSRTTWRASWRSRGSQAVAASARFSRPRRRRRP